MPYKYQLIFDKKKLEDNRTLEDYDIKDHSIILLHYYRKFAIFIKIKEKIILLNVEESERIINIKEKIIFEDRILPTNKYNLLLNGKRLDEYKTLDYYEIREGYTIDLVYCSLTPILVKTWTGNSLYLNVETTDTIRYIKEQIEYLFGINRKLQRLIFKGKQLEDEKTLYDYNIQKEQEPNLDLVIHLTLRLRGGH